MTGVGILRIVAGKALRGQGRIVDGPGEHAHLVEAAGGAQDAMARDEPEAGLESHDAAEGGRPDHRAVGLGAHRQRTHPRAHGRGRSAGRSTRSVGGIVWIASLAWREVREFSGDGLAQDHRAGPLQPGNQGRILQRPAAGVQDGSVFGRQVGGIDVVLHGDRHAVQRADHPPCLAQLIAVPGLSKGEVAIQALPGRHLRLARIDPVQAGREQLHAEDVAGGDRARGLGCGQQGQIVRVHGKKSISGSPDIPQSIAGK